MIEDGNKSKVNNQSLSDKEPERNKGETSNSQLPVGISLGLCIGVALGIVFKNIGIGTAVGVCVGAFMGHRIKTRNN